MVSPLKILLKIMAINKGKGKVSGRLKCVDPGNTEFCNSCCIMKIYC